MTFVLELIFVTVFVLVFELSLEKSFAIKRAGFFSLEAISKIQNVRLSQRSVTAFAEDCCLKRGLRLLA